MDEKRYDDRPLLRLPEAYLLSLIGALPEERERQVAEIVWKQLGGGLEWRTTVREAAGLPADFDRRLRELWKAQPSGVDPIQFMLRVSDENFVPLIDAG